MKWKKGDKMNKENFKEFKKTAKSFIEDLEEYYNPTNINNLEQWTVCDYPMFIDENRHYCIGELIKPALEVWKPIYYFEEKFEKLWEKTLKEYKCKSPYDLPKEVYFKTTDKIGMILNKIVNHHYFPLMKEWVYKNSIWIHNWYGASLAYCIYWRCIEYLLNQYGNLLWKYQEKIG